MKPVELRDAIIVLANQITTLHETGTVTPPAPPPTPPPTPPPPVFSITLTGPGVVTGGTNRTALLTAQVTGVVSGVTFGIKSGPGVVDSDMSPETTTPTAAGTYEFPWSLDPRWTPAGTYQLFARVRRGDGSTVTSALASVVVTQPVVLPPPAPPPVPPPAPLPPPPPPVPVPPPPPPAPVPVPTPGALPVALPAAVSRWMGPLTPASATPAAFKRYETDFAPAEAARWADVGQGRGVPGSPCKPGPDIDYTNYYDRAFVLYQMWARTGNATYRAHADAIAICYRDGYLKANRYAISGMHNQQLEGLAIHYWLTGEPESKKAVVEAARWNAKTFHEPKMFKPGYYHWEGRIAARVLLASLLALELGDTSEPWGAFVDEYATSFASLQLPTGGYSWQQSVDSNEGTATNYAQGMLNYAWAKYYRLRNQNPVILAAIKRNLDYLWATQWRGTGFPYHNRGTTPVADINGLLVYGWGFYASVTGNLAYQAMGDQIFAAGIVGAYLSSDKPFNQQYRETALYLGLRR